MDSSTEASKKVSLEECSKDEVIKKYRSLVGILQQAKQSKKLLSEENAVLKKQLETQNDTDSTATRELIENLTQQKLSLVTSLDETKTQKDTILAKLKSCEIRLKDAEAKIINLDTENESHQRQINRLTEENDQLLIHLDALAKETEELKRIGLEQQNQLLELEKKNTSSSEIFEDVRQIDLLKEEYETLRKTNCGLQISNEKLTAEMDILQARYNDAQVMIINLKDEVRVKSEKIENNSNLTDDLNIELHKNKALVDKLQHDIANLTNVMSNNHIESSCIESDLVNTNEKLKERLKHLRSKIVKFAGDVKALKSEKGLLLETFKINVNQIKEWENQLQKLTKSILTTFESYENEKMVLNSEIESFKLQIHDIELKNENLEVQNDALKNTIDNLQENLDSFEIQKDSQEEVSQLHSQLISMTETNNQLQDGNTVLTDELKILKDQNEREKNKFKAEMEELTELHRTLNDSYQLMLTDCNLQRDHIDAITSENNNLSLELQKLSTSNSQYQKEIENLQSEVLTIKQKFEEKLQELKSLEDYIQNLQTDNERLEKTNQELNHNCEECSKTVEEQNKVIHELKEKLNRVESTTVDEVNKELEIQRTRELHIAEMKQQLDTVRKENAELLNEMNEMNQVLKERGEVISQQQTVCEDLLKKAQTENTHNNQLAKTLREKEEIIAKMEQNINLIKEESVAQSTSNSNEMYSTLKKKDEEITNLQNELMTLKDKLLSSLDTSQDANYAESENMSTSTVSKIEDMNRMKDLESSWEEKYGKLRNLAVKLKGKIRELTVDLSTEQSEKTDLQAKYVNSVKSAQTLQAQCDKLQDEVDQSKVDIKKYMSQVTQSALDISNSKKQLADNEELICKLKNDLEHLTKEKSNTEIWKKEIGGKVQNLRKELEAHNVLKKDFENQISKLNLQLESKEKQLRDEIEKHNATKVSLQELNNECKKQSVLNLEMQDYERSLKDLTQKLEKKQELITKLKNQIDTQRSSVNNVKEQNRLLEDRIQHEETDLTSARSEIQLYKKKIAEFEVLIIQKDDQIQDLTRSLEANRAENEDLAMQLSKVMSSNQKSFSTLKNEKDYLMNQNLIYEQKIHKLEDDLKIKEEDLQRLSAEYQGYKVRAQSVLRQNQTRDIGLEEKLSEEIISFKAQIGNLQSEAKQLKNTLKQTTDRNEQLQIDMDRLLNTNMELQTKCEDSGVQLENLQSKHQKMIAEHAETIRSLKVHSDTLSQCYRQQISEQEIRHNREVIELQSKIEKATPLPTEVPQFSPQAILREQGEGSESVDMTAANVRPIPLDRLLMSTEIDQDPILLKKQITESEVKVSHLTALLADTAQDLAKHVQMNELLKEEIRRQQRSVEREKHAENLEYLKNVIFKFATLTSGDERSRLVPVLNTILKFSPEETNKLNLVARGELSNRSWSNYLPAWSSTGKPQ